MGCSHVLAPLGMGGVAPPDIKFGSRAPLPTCVDFGALVGEVARKPLICGFWCGWRYEAPKTLPAYLTSWSLL
jgi:hypothetical protein